MWVVLGRERGDEGVLERVIGFEYYDDFFVCRRDCWGVW